MTSRSADVVIVGGSVAATRAAEAITRHAPQLGVTVVSDEPHLPYERPPLSKTAHDKPLDLEKLTYPAVAGLQEAGVRFVLGTRAEGLDPLARTVATSGGTIGYGSLVITTGCDPVVPPLFAGQDNVFTLRRYEDAEALRAAVADPGTSVAIVGAGFIGGEFAATLSSQGREVALIDLARRPLGRFGDPVADAYEDMHRRAHVTLHLGRTVTRAMEDSARRRLVLEDGTEVPADVILLGTGVRPSTVWLAGSGLTLDDGIVCDTTLQAAERIFAAGDAARWPNPRYGVTMRVEHWTTAAEQGRVAGLNAANAVLGTPPADCASVPYFWSDQHGVRIQFAGHRTGDEDIISDHDDRGSLFLYRRGDAVTGVLAFDRRPLFVKLRAALRKHLPWDTAQELLQQQK